MVYRISFKFLADVDIAVSALCNESICIDVSDTECHSLTLQLTNVLEEIELSRLIYYSAEALKSYLDSVLWLKMRRFRSCVFLGSEILVCKKLCIIVMRDSIDYRLVLQSRALELSLSSRREDPLIFQLDLSVDEIEIGATM
ncbi:hypothetical protein Tco_0803418 [Tanacetum coccineum]|uniref:Uncharacterized protein n=1 Tax=Tanacetum coccineum TaxID=301880 RepID=A0ABQ5A1H9_9ASTR